MERERERDVYICIYTHVYIYIYIYMYICIHIHIHVYTYLYMCIRTYHISDRPSCQWTPKLDRKPNVCSFVRSLATVVCSILDQSMLKVPKLAIMCFMFKA